MTGFITTRILGKVTKVDEGTAKTGKAWFRANVAVSIYNFGTKGYDQRLVNVVGFDKVAEAMKTRIKPGVALFAEGEAKPGKPFKTNSGQELTPIDLVARDWYLAGVVQDREQPAQQSADTDPSDPFA